MGSHGKFLSTGVACQNYLLTNCVCSVGIDCKGKAEAWETNEEALAATQVR